MAKQLNVNLAVTADIGQAKAQLQSLQQSLNQLTSNSANLKIGLDATQLQEASAKITELGVHLKQATNTDTGTLNFAKLSTSIKASGSSLQEYGTQLLKLGPQGQQAFTQLASAVAKSETPIRRLSGLLGNMGTVLTNTIRWQLSSSAIHGFIGGIQQAFGYAKDLNKSLTDIQIVTQASDEHMAKFAEQANKSAKALSTTTTAYTKASLIYYQQGLNDQQVKERTDVTVKMANITGQTAQQVSDQLTAIWNNFADGSTNLEYYADVITALGAATASSSEEISRGLQKFAAIADTVGLSYENATAALATITATTRQSADSVGTGLRTLFSRLQSLKLGETLEDGVDLTKYSNALKTIGVDVLDAAGNLRSMDDILEDMGAKWQDLSDAQKTALAQTVGGVRQYTTLMALMENFDFYKQNQEVAAMSEGTVQAQADIYAKSWEASQKRVKASAEAIYSDLINDKFFIGLNNGLSKFLNIIDNIIDGLGGLKGLLSSIGAIALKLFNNEATQGLVNFSNNIRTMFMSPQAVNAEKTNFLTWASEQMAGHGASDEQVEFAKQQIKLQQDYVARVMSMSPVQKTTYQQYLDNYDKQRLQYAQIEEHLNQRQKNQTAIGSDLWSSSANGGFQAARIKELKSFVKEYNDTLAKGFSNISGDQYQKMNNYLTQGRVKWVNGKLQMFGTQSPFELNRDQFNQALSDQIEEPLKKFPEYEETLQNFTGNVKDLESALTSKGMDSNLITQITKAYETGGLDGAIKAFNQLNAEQIGANVKGFAEAWGVSVERVQQYVDEVKAAGNDTAKLKQIKDQMEQDVKSAGGVFGQQNKQIDTAQGIMSLSQGIMSVSAASSALNGLASTIEQVVNGSISAGDALTSVGSSIGTMGLMGVMAFNSLTKAAEAFNISLSAGPLALITVALIALPTIIKLIDNAFETQEEKIERIKEETNSVQEWSKKAVSAIDNLTSKTDSHNALLDTLSSLEEGTIEFYNALVKANAEAEELIGIYGLIYGQDWNISNGAITFTKSGQESMTSQAKAEALQGLYQSAFANLYNEYNQKQEALDLAEKANIAPDSRNPYTYKQQFENAKALYESQGTNAVQYLDIQTTKSDGVYKALGDAILAATGMSLSTYLASGGTWESAIQGSQNYTASFGRNYIDNILSTYTSSLDNGQNSFEQEIARNLTAKQFSAESLSQSYEEALENITFTGDALKSLFVKELGYTPTEDLTPDQMKQMIARNRVITKLQAEYQKQNTSSIKAYSDYQKMSLPELKAAMGELDRSDAIQNEAYKKLNDYLTSTTQNINNRLVELGLRTETQTRGPYGSILTESTGLSAEDLNMTGAEWNTWNQLQSQALAAFGEEGGFADALGLQLIGNGEKFQQALQETLSTVDWTSSLSATLDIARLSQQAQTSGKSIASDLTQTYENALDAIGGKKGLLEELYNSADFQDSLTDLQDTFKETGKLSAKDIKEAADSCDILNDYLKYGDQSASALAAALEVMGMGGASSIDQISEAFLNAMGLAGAFEDQLQDVFSYIDSFTADRSIQDIADFFIDTSDDMFTELGNGNFGGERLYQEAAAVWGDAYATNLKNFFIEQQREALENDLGPEVLQEAYSDQFDKFDEVMSTVANEGNMRAYWDFLLNGGGDQILGKEVNGQYGYSNIEVEGPNGEKQRLTISEALKEHAGITNVDKNGDIEADLQGRTTKEFTQDVADALGISYDEAAVRVQEMSGKSAALTQDLKRNDATAGLLALGQGHEQMTGMNDHGQAQYDITAKSIEQGFNEMSWAEQTAFLQKYGDVLKDVDAELGTNLTEINAQRKAQQDSVAQLRANNATQQEMNDSIANTVAAQKDLIATTEINGETQKDFGQTVSNLTSAGYTEQEVWQAAADGAIDLSDAVYVAEDAFGNKLAVAVEDANGNLKDMETIMSEAETAIHDSNIAHDAEIQAKAMVEAFKNASIEPIEVTINAQDGGSVATIQEAIDTIEGKDANINVSDNGTVSAVQTAINGIVGKDINIPINGVDNVTSVVDSIIEQNQGKTITIGVDTGGGSVAKGGYVYGAHAGGGPVKSNRIRPGLSLTGEEGTEIVWNKEKGYSYVVGEKHPEFVTLYPGDRVFNAQETKEILGSNALGGKVYESNAWPRNDATYSSGVGPKKNGGSSSGSSSSSSSNANDYDPERYHLITRQIKDLEREYDRLSKIKDNCYGTNRVEAIQAEIDAQHELMKGQEELIHQAEDWLKLDTKNLEGLLEAGELQFDANGNLANFDALQDKYKRMVDTGQDLSGNDLSDEDKEHVEEIWNAIEQYEETLDKLQEANKDMREYLYQEMELRLEAIQVKTELKIDFDERDLKLIEHFTKKIDDNIYDTARVLQLAGLSLDKINDKIDTTQQGIDEIFKNMTDSKGNQITDMTLEKFLSLSEAERDALDINNDFGKQLEEYSDDLLDYIEELEDFKTKGINELNTAFDELNDNIQSSMDLFSYYQDTLDNLKNIIDLQGVTISKDLRDVFQTVNQTLLSNNANNIQAELVRYEKLRDVVTDLQNKLSTVTDPTLQKEWENQLKEAEEALRNSQTNLLTLWQDGLDMAKQVFEQNIDNAVREFEEQVAGAYGDLNGLQAAYDRRKEIDNFYVDDYEKYYQISKLQRQINKDLNDAAKNHNKNVKGLNILFDDLNDAREAGVELTAYDLDIFAKRYAYEKALMDLEDSRNAKQQVRLQRDANGNWGYVYTAAEDDDDLIRKQQAVEDALYEWQKATTAEANRYSDEILPKIRANLEAIAEAYKTGSDIPQNILNDTKELLSLWGPQFQKTLEDGAQTLDIAIDKYNNASFDIFDNLNESGLAAVLETGEGINQLLDILISQMDTTNDEMNTASINYKNQIDNLNNFFKEYGDSLGTVINAWAQAVGEDSEENKANTTQMIENAKLTFDEILSAANEFEDKFMEKYEPIISRNEQFIIALNEALDALNRKEFVQGQLLPYIGSYIDPSSFASGGFTGAWGSGGRLAVLHEKENVFNAEDTSRLLSASQILRTIDLSISSFAAGFGNILLPNPGPIGNSLDQNVHIEASFPSVTDHNEIELAFDNLINKASQYANRKNMSSMTFQDMYTSKF